MIFSLSHSTQVARNTTQQMPRKQLNEGVLERGGTELVLDVQGFTLKGSTHRDITQKPTHVEI